MSTRDVMQQALEALNLPSMKTMQMLQQRDEAIATLRAALAEEALQRLTDVQQEIEAALEQPDRQSLQAEGKHPAPCARHCEAKAFEIEIRSLKSALRAALEQPEPYDQTALELCEVCCWKTLIPGDGCLNCERKAQPEQEPVALIRDGVLRWYIPHEHYSRPAWAVHGTHMLYAQAQPQRKPLTDEDIEQAQRTVWRSLPSDFDYTTSSWIEIGIRYAEAAHGIGEKP